MNKFLWLRREWQRYRASHLLITATMVLGLGGVFLIERLKEAFLSSVRSQERELLSSDLSLGARRPLKTEEIERFEKATKDYAEASYRVIDMSSMLYAPGQEAARLVEVRVVEPGFPFYGSLLTADGNLKLTADHPLFNENCIWLHEEATRLFDVKVGDELRLGEGTFRHCGTVLKDSTQGFRGFALAPRVYLGRSRLADTQLVGEGTIASHALHYKLRSDAAKTFTTEWKDALVKEFDDPAIRIQRPSDTSEQTARSGKLFGDYLQLASLVALILAVVGTFYLFRTLVHRRLKDIAILRALGVAPGEARKLLLLPLATDFLVAIPLAGLFSAALFPIVTGVLDQLFGTQLPPTGFPWSVWPALPLIFTLVMAILMPSVEEAVRVPVMALLQDQERVGMVPWRQAGLWGLLALVSLSGLAIWAAHSWKIGGLFVAGILLATLTLAGFTLLARWVGEKVLRRSGHISGIFGLMGGLVIRRLLRRPMTTLLTVIALGLGSVLISLLGHLELSIGQEFSLESQDRPALFMFDIQDEQTEKLKDFLAETKVPLQALSPMVRGKLVSVNDQAFKKDKQEGMFQTREEENESRFRQRMMNLSWASGLNPSETLEEGVDFADAKVPDGEVALSLEKRFAQRLGIELDDQLTFEVLGVPLIGRVVNVRSVKWTSFRPNFFITFAPGALEDAPKSWLAAIGQMPAQEKVKLQNQISRKFPNISSIDVGQLVTRMMELFTRLKKALQLMALFAFLVGVVVVGAMAQDQVLRRQNEVMLEKTLGISPWRVTLMVLGEFLGLAFVAFTLGGLAGAGLAAVLTVVVFEGNVIWSASLLLSITLGGMILVSIPLLLMAKKIFTWRPAGLLQQP